MIDTNQAPSNTTHEQQQQQQPQQPPPQIPQQQVILNQAVHSTVSEHHKPESKLELMKLIFHFTQNRCVQFKKNNNFYAGRFRGNVSVY